MDPDVRGTHQAPGSRHQAPGTRHQAWTSAVAAAELLCFCNQTATRPDGAEFISQLEQGDKYLQHGRRRRSSAVGKFQAIHHLSLFLDAVQNNNSSSSRHRTLL